MEWRDAPVVSMGASQRFYVTRGEEKIPGILWTPEESAGALPLTD